MKWWTEWGSKVSALDWSLFNKFFVNTSRKEQITFNCNWYQRSCKNRFQRCNNKQGKWCEGKQVSQINRVEVKERQWQNSSLVYTYVLHCRRDWLETISIANSLDHKHPPFCWGRGEVHTTENDSATSRRMKKGNDFKNFELFFFYVLVTA